MLALTDRTSEHVQDAGEVGMIGDRLRALHLKACQLAKPDGVALARRLFAHVIASDFTLSRTWWKPTRSFLERQRLAEFRRFAEERLAGLLLPPPEPPEINGDIP